MFRNASVSVLVRKVVSQAGHLSVDSEVTQMGMTPSNLSTVLMRNTSVRLVSEQDRQRNSSSTVSTISRSSVRLYIYFMLYKFGDIRAAGNVVFLGVAKCEACQRSSH